MKTAVSISLIFVVGMILSHSGLASSLEGATPKPGHSKGDLTADTVPDQEQTYARYLKQMDRLEKNMDRQDADIARYEKILANWERQQAEYQKYLDGLAHK